MSSPLAIAAVSAVMKDLLDNALVDHSVNATLGALVTVTAVAPDLIELNGDTDPQLNLYLYRVTPNQGWRNAGLPSMSANGQRLANPPLALDLHYLLTAYASQDFQAEILLGYAMQMLHEVPVLTRDAIRTTLGTPSPVGDDLLPPALGSFVAADLADQVELVKLTLDQMSTEEISKLWAAFGATYRPTAAYRASVVLIDRRQPVHAPLPVQTRQFFVRSSLEGATTPIVSPEEIDGLQLWLRSDVGVTYDSDGVARWADQSGNDPAHDAFQNDDALRPAFVGHALGGRPALRFDGVDDYLALDNLRYDTAAELDGLTVCALVRSHETQRQVIASFDRSEAWRLALKDGTNVNVGWDTADENGTVRNLRSPRAYTDGNWHLICGWFGQGETPDKRLFIDGEQVAPNPATDPPPTFHNGRALGTGTTRFGFIGVGSEASTVDGARGPNWFFAGDLVEVLVYHRALTDEEREQLERYFITRYRP